jgi:hypothetical protein
MKKYTFWIISMIVGLGLFFLFISKCSTKKADTVITTTETLDLRQRLTDSLTSIIDANKIAEIQAVKAEEAKKTAKYKENAKYFAKIALNQKHISDSLQNLIPETDTTCLKTIASKQKEIEDCENENEQVHNEAENYSNQLYLCEKQSFIKDTIIINKNDYINKSDRVNNDLRKAIKRNFVERNGIVIGGTLATTLILVLKIFIFK